jgi:hypothetical protein
MGDLLTTASLLMCPHGGLVTVEPTSSVTVHGDAIVLDSDDFAVDGCLSDPPCLLVVWQTTAERSNCRGSATLTSESIGACVTADGATQGFVAILATQTRARGL